MYRFTVSMSSAQMYKAENDKNKEMRSVSKRLTRIVQTAAQVSFNTAASDHTGITAHVPHINALVTVVMTREGFI